MEANIIVGILNVLQAGFTYLTNRGITRERIQTILDDADGGDVSTEVVQMELDSLAAELDETARLLQEDETREIENNENAPED